MAVPDADLDRLFALPLGQFVAERKRIGRALAQAGQRDDARAVDKLPRPSVSAWAVNQVARRDPALVRRLGDLTERLRGAQGRGGHGGDDDLAAMTAEHRQVLGSLRDLVDQVLASAGNDASPQLLRRVITNLRAGVAAPDTRPLVEGGRLVRDVAEADFTTLFEALPPSGAASPGSRTSGRTPPPTRLGSAPPSPTGHAAHATHAAHSSPPAHHAERDHAEAAAQMAAERAAREAGRERDKARASAERRIVRLREAAAKARHALVDEERAVAVARTALAAREEHLSHTRAASETADAAVAEIEAELARLEHQS